MDAAGVTQDELAQRLLALTHHVETSEALDPAVDAVTRAVDAAVPRGALRDALHGRTIGHPLHPVLVAVPIGLFSSAVLLDLVGGRSSRGAARRLVGAGVLTVAPTAAAGLADWASLGQAAGPRRVGLVHAAANVVSTALYAASWVARGRGQQRRGQLLALLGGANLVVGGYLGGHLAYTQAVGVNRNADAPREPTGWTDVAAADDVPEGTLVRVDAAGQPLALARSGGRLAAVGATCSHWGAPLDEGELSDGCVVCPWHGSVFRLADGAVARGPATAPQPSYEVRERDGRVEVRARG